MIVNVMIYFKKRHILLLLRQCHWLPLLYVEQWAQACVNHLLVFELTSGMKSSWQGQLK